PVRTADGVLVGVSKIARDITAQKQLETRLSLADRARAQLAALVDSCEDAIIGKDLFGYVTSWNRAAERMYGYTAQEAIGKSIRLVIGPERWAEEDDVLARIR